MPITMKCRSVRAKFLPRTSTRQQLLFTHDELRQLLNDDLRRERKAVYAYAVYGDKLRASGRVALATQVEERGRFEAEHAVRIEQLIHDFGGRVEATVDELNAILSADRVAAAEWSTTTLERLHDRARHLRTAGFPGLAKRMTRIIAEKRRAKDLCELLASEQSLTAHG